MKAWTQLLYGRGFFFQGISPGSLKAYSLYVEFVFNSFAQLQVFNRHRGCHRLLTAVYYDSSPALMRHGADVRKILAAPAVTLGGIGYVLDSQMYN
jgi:hypothetical protein